MCVVGDRKPQVRQEALGEGGGLPKSAGRGLHGAVRYLLHCPQNKQQGPACSPDLSAVSHLPHQILCFGIMKNPLVQLILSLVSLLTDAVRMCCKSPTLVGNRPVLAIVQLKELPKNVCL